MTEDLKFIVAEINKILKTDYNLISFDSLSIENLLQILLDVLEKFGAATKVMSFRIDYNVGIMREKKTGHSSMSRNQIQQIPTNIYWNHWRRSSTDRSIIMKIRQLFDVCYCKVIRRPFIRSYNLYLKMRTLWKISHIWRSKSENLGVKKSKKQNYFFQIPNSDKSTSRSYG